MRKDTEKLWCTVYRAHESNINEVWNSEKQSQ